MYFRVRNFITHLTLSSPIAVDLTNELWLHANGHHVGTASEFDEAAYHNKLNEVAAGLQPHLHPQPPGLTPGQNINNSFDIRHQPGFDPAHMQIHHYESLIDYHSGEYVPYETGIGGLQPQYEFYEPHAPGAGLEAAFGGYAAFTNEHTGGVDVVEHHHHHLGKPFSA